MAQTKIFVGNLGQQIFPIGRLSLHPGAFIEIDNKFPISWILHSNRLIYGLAEGLISIKYGGTAWSDSTSVSDMEELYAALSDDEKALAAAGSSFVI